MKTQKHKKRAITKDNDRFIHNLPSSSINPLCSQNSPKIVPVLIHMKRKGYEESTLTGISRRLKHLDRHTDLTNPESVTFFIMNKKATNGYKNNLSIAYLHFARFYNLDFKLNILKHKSKHIRIPTTEELNSLINSAHNPLSLKLRVFKETGLRPIELVMLRTNDIDLERKTIYPTTAKNGSARTLKISDGLATLLQTYIIKHDRNPNSLLFNTKTKALRTNYSVSRNRTAKHNEKHTSTTDSEY